MNDKKMTKIAGTLYTIVNIIEKIVLVGGILLVIGAALFFLFRTQASQAEITSISLGNLAIQLAQGVPADNAYITSIYITMAAAAVILVLLWYGMRIVRKILQPMKEGYPFDEHIADHFSSLGKLVLIGGVLVNATEIVSQYMLMKAIDLQSMFNTSNVSGVRYHFSFGLEFVFLAMALFLLSYIFRYGAQLQQESDETL